MDALRLGPRPIPRKGLTSRNLLRAIDTVINNTEIREKAKKMGECLRNTDGLKDTVEFLETSG